MGRCGSVLRRRMSMKRSKTSFRCFATGLVVIVVYLFQLRGGLDDYYSESNITYTNDGTIPNNGPDDSVVSIGVTYPLADLNLTSATRCYQKGFWQQTPPVPLSRWEALSKNTTCINNHRIASDRRDEKFHRRVPFVMVLGAQKAGTTALVNYLYTHPHIQRLPTKELRYFDEYLDQNSSILQGDGSIDAAKVLRTYQEDVIGDNIPLEVLKLSSYLKILDGTPNYLWTSDRVPQRILCAAPRVKLIVLLRNPIDRAFSQYNMQYHRDLKNPENRRGFVTFEEYVEMDIQVLTDLGILSDKVATAIDEEYLLSPDFMAAWATYTKLGLNSPVGRGLYTVQLAHWLQAFQTTGKDPNDDLLVLQNERMNNDTKAIYEQVLRFLKLPHHVSPEFGKIHTTTYRVPQMEKATRARLGNIFRPFNRHLEKLLGVEWHVIWDG